MNSVTLPSGEYSQKTWTVRLEVASLANEHEKLQKKEKLREILSDKTLYVSKVEILRQFLERSAESEEKRMSL